VNTTPRIESDIASEAISRRDVLRWAGVGLAAGAAATTVVPTAAAESAGQSKADSFRYCLNTATIRGQKLPLSEEARIAAQAGYQAIEPWLQEISDYAAQGGSLPDLKKQIADLGLTVESSVGFTNWITDEADRGPGGFEQWKRNFEMVAAIGGKRVCAPPTGVAYKTPQDLYEVAARYRKLIDLGAQAGVVPQIELWGRAKTLCRMGEVALVMVESGHPDACAVLDVFHIYMSGSDFGGLRVFNGATLHSFHMNDYPADPPRETINDGSRIYPGDGVAPLASVLRDLRDIGFRGVLSLELFNREYWKQDALTVARVGLEKMRSVVAKALA
jgi:2-keto-myo-inositol isomerase